MIPPTLQARTRSSTTTARCTNGGDGNPQEAPRADRAGEGRGPAVPRRRSRSPTPTSPTTNNRYVKTVVDAYMQIGIQVKLKPLPAGRVLQQASRPSRSSRSIDMSYAGWIPDWANGSAVIPPLFEQLRGRQGAGVTRAAPTTLFLDGRGDRQGDRRRRWRRPSSSGSGSSGASSTARSASSRPSPSRSSTERDPAARLQRVRGASSTAAASDMPDLAARRPCRTRRGSRLRNRNRHQVSLSSLTPNSVEDFDHAELRSRTC